MREISKDQKHSPGVTIFIVILAATWTLIGDVLNAAPDEADAAKQNILGQWITAPAVSWQQDATLWLVLTTVLLVLGISVLAVWNWILKRRITGYTQELQKKLADHKQAEEKLKNNQKFLDNILDQSPFPTWISDINGTMIRANPALTKALNLSDEQLIGKYNVFQDTNAEKNNLLEIFNDALEKGKTSEFTLIWSGKEIKDLNLKDSNTVYAEGNVFPIYNNEGKITNLVVTWKDASARKYAEEELHKSEERFRRLAENAQDMIYHMSLPDGRYEYVSPASTRILGHTPEEFLNSPLLIQEVIHPDWHEYFKKQWEALQVGKMLPFYEYQIIHGQSGETRWLNQRNVLIQDDAGQPTAIEAIVTDITDRKLGEEKLLASMQKLALHIEHTPLAVIGWDLHFKVIEWNPAAEIMFGYKQEEALGKHASFIVEESAREHVDVVWEKLLNQRCGIRSNNENVTKDGRPILCDWFNTPLIDNQNEVVGVTSLVMDITERNQVEEARREHIQFLENLEKIEQAINRSANPDQMLNEVIETVFQLFECDRAWLLYPCDPDAPSFRLPIESARPEFPGGKILDLNIPMTPAMQGDMNEALAAGGPVTYGPGNEKPISMDTHNNFNVQSQMFMSIHPKTGSPWMFGIHQCSYPRVWTKQEQRLFNEIGRRIADGLSSLLFLRDLEKSEQQYRLLAENVTDVIWTMDMNLRLTYVSPSIFQLRGYTVEEAMAQSLEEMIVPESIIEIRPLIKQKLQLIENGDEEGWSPLRFDAEMYRKDGSTIITHINMKILKGPDGKPNLIVGVTHDITDRKRAETEQLALERQMQHAQKLESLGVLAGGIAHDFNNILMAVLGYADLAIRDISETHPARSYLIEIEKGAQRAADLTRQMLAYSGKGSFIIEKMDVSALMEDMSNLLRTAISRTITLNLHLDRSLPPIEADVTQIQQVVMNLITNAADAISDGIGVVTLSTGKAECTEEYLTQSLIIPASPGETPPGVYVYFEVSDNGCGMDKDTKAKIFEPFFTTKFTGRGLGMAAVLGIIRGHKGAILLDTAPGQGATFRILFPALEGKHMDAAQKNSKSSETENLTEQGVILVIDDEEIVRKLTTRFLNRMGFTVLTAENGREGVKVFREHAQEIICILLDLTMPLMGGAETLEELLIIQPDVRVILCSGYNEQTISQRFEGKGLAGFIQKPYNMTNLQEKLDELLGDKHSDPDDKLPGNA